VKISLEEYWELLTCVELTPEQADLIHDQRHPWVFLFTLPNGNRLRIPRYMASLGQVPDPWRPLLETFFHGLPPDLLRSVLSGCPDPWQDYDPELWGQETAERLNSERMATRSAWDQRMHAAGLSSLWLHLQSLMRSGCLNPESLLQHALLSSPSASQIVALLQVLNEVFEKGYPEGHPPPWTTVIVPDVRWEAQTLWGELRSSLHPLRDPSEVVDVLLKVLALSKQDSGWGEVLRQMHDYAAPVWAGVPLLKWPMDAFLFFQEPEDPPEEAP
jgi:hypothetical protein